MTDGPDGHGVRSVHGLLLPDGSVRVPPKWANYFVALATRDLRARVASGRSGTASPVFMALITSLQTAASQEEERSSSVAGTTVSDPASVVLGDLPWLTSGQAAILLECSSRAGTKALEEGRLLGRKAGPHWMIHPSDLDRYRFGAQPNGKNRSPVQQLGE
jgi:hypothetical protein